MEQLHDKLLLQVGLFQAFVCVESPAQAGTANPASEVNWANVGGDVIRVIRTSKRGRPWV